MSGKDIYEMNGELTEYGELLERVEEIERKSISKSIRGFLQLLYSLCKQYIAWYELEIKAKKL